MLVTEDSNLGQVLKDCPQSIDIFVQHGFKQLKLSADPTLAARAAAQVASFALVGPPCAVSGPAWSDMHTMSIRMAAFYMGMSREKIDALVKDLAALEC